MRRVRLLSPARRSHYFMKLSERLDKYRLVLRQLDLCQAELHGLGFITDADQRRIEKFVDDEKARVDRALKAFPLLADAETPAPTGPPSIERARAAGAGRGA